MEAPKRKSGVVIPQKAKWHGRLAGWLIWCSVMLISRTLRYRVDDATWKVVEQLNKPVIFCIWHNRLFLSVILFNRYVRAFHPERRLVAMISASRDGGLLSCIMELLGVHPVRGSTSRRGPQAIRELITCSKAGYDLSITPDGPRGPCYHLQEGVIIAAQLTGMPIVLAAYSVPWKYRARSWDRFIIPLPFSHCDVRLGSPIYVDRDTTPEQREIIRQQLEKTLVSMTVD